MYCKMIWHNVSILTRLVRADTRSDDDDERVSFTKRSSNAGAMDYTWVLTEWSEKEPE